MTGGRLLGAVLATVALAGCVGATPRDEFEAEVRARGGGLSNEFITGSLDVMAAEVGATSWTELEVLALSARPGNRSVTANVRNAVRPDFVDTIAVVDGEVASSTPIQDAGDLPLDEVVIPLGGLPLDRVEDLADEALAAFDQPGGYVEALGVVRTGSGVRIDIDVESDRETATVTFSSDGTLEAIE